jgi:hypothetical protein
MMDQQEEDENLRAKRIGSMCGTIEAIGHANGSGEQYLSALAICAGIFMRRVPDPALKVQMLHHFLSEVRRISKDPK